jgi:putative restriction endonuclease
MQRAPSVKWTREHALIALNLHCKLPFGQLHKGNAIIKEVAARMGRSAGSLAMKLDNFASLDPVLRARGIRGLPKVAAADRKIWAEFHDNIQVLAPRASNCCTNWLRKTIKPRWTCCTQKEYGSNGHS